MKITIFWFRRDLRLEDNTALLAALNSDLPVLPVFIFDTNITDELPGDDARINFIYESLLKLNKDLEKYNSSIHIYKGKPENIFKDILNKYEIKKLFYNKDYEPYAIARDKTIDNIAKENNIEVQKFKDHVIFEENEILKSDSTPYTVFTPYKNNWLSKFQHKINVDESIKKNFFTGSNHFPSLENLKFRKSVIKVKESDLNNLNGYDKNRNIPSLDAGSYLGPHLRFGTLSIRKIVKNIVDNESFLNELIWREFFMQILFHFPHVVNNNFNSKYNHIRWRNNEKEFELWCEGKTGYPMVDAGMRQLNETGYMHNRVRMVTASFLTKHLLIDWRWGEAYFAKKLLDYELASNNGNWQWAAGTGCDAAPYFRIFNPLEQQRKFDPDFKYIEKWVPEYNSPDYPQPIVEHSFARKRALETYKKGLSAKY